MLNLVKFKQRNCAAILKSSRCFFILAFACVLFLFFFRLGDRSFRNPDEGRYAEIAREMVISNHWVEPKLYGIDYLSKPPLFYWLLAASFRIFGFNEWAARAVPATFGFLGVLMTYFFTRRYFGKQAAIFAGLILATNFWYVQVSRYLVIDAVFSFFLTACLFSFYAFLRDDRREFLFLFYIFSALAFLCKGIAGVALPGVVVVAYFLILRRWKEPIPRSISPGGMLLFLLIAFPWFFAITLRKPWFPEYFLWHEHVSRYLSKSFEHQEGWYFYFVLAPLVFLPWTLCLPALRKMRSERGFTRDRRLYFWVIFAGILLFYSVSRSKLATYLLPVLAPGAILLGDAWASWTESPPDKNISIVKNRLFYALTGVLFIASIGAPFVMERLNTNYTTKPFAKYLRPSLVHGEKVFIYGAPGALYDFSFYLNYPVKPVGLEGEFEQAAREPQTKEAMITPEAWKKLLKNEKIFCLMRKSDYEGLDGTVKKDMQMLMQDERKILVASIPS